MLLYTGVVSGLVVFVFGSVSVLKSLELVLGTTTPGALDHGRTLWLLYFLSPVEPTIRAGVPVYLAIPAGHWFSSTHKCHLLEVLISGVGLCCLLSYGRTFGFVAPAGPDSYAANMLYAGVTWSLAISHVMSISQCIVADFGYAPGPAFRQP